MMNKRIFGLLSAIALSLTLMLQSFPAQVQAAVSIKSATISAGGSTGNSQSDLLKRINDLKRVPQENQNQVSITVNPSHTAQAPAAVPKSTEAPATVPSEAPKSAEVPASGNSIVIRPAGSVASDTGRDGSDQSGADELPPSVSEIRVSPDTLRLHVGESAALAVAVTPSAASGAELLFGSSDESVAVIDGDFTVRAKQAGTAVITVSTRDGQVSGTCEVTVAEPVLVREFAAAPSDLTSLLVGDTGVLTIKALPADASNQAYHISVLDDTILSFREKGSTYEALKPGITQLLITAEDSGQAVTSIDVAVAEPKKYRFSEDTYQFANTAASFGYGSTYSIPLETYVSVLGKQDGYLYWDAWSNGKPWSGSCFGMAATSSSFFKGDEKLVDFGNVSALFGLAPPKDSAASLTKLIERYHVAQALVLVSSSRTETNGNIASIVAAVADFERTGKEPVVLVVAGNHYGHAVVPYAVKNLGGGQYDIMVWDNNYPATGSSSVRSVRVNVNGNTWSYALSPATLIGSGSQNSEISVVKYSAIKTGLSNGNADAYQKGSSMYTASFDNAVVSDENGLPIDQVEGAMLVKPLSGNFSDYPVVYRLPDQTTFTVTSKNEAAPVEVGVSNDEVYAKLESTGKDVHITVNEAADFIVTSESESRIVLSTSKGIEIQGTVKGSYRITDVQGSAAFLGDAKLTIRKDGVTTEIKTRAGEELDLNGIKAGAAQILRSQSANKRNERPSQ
ncbi:MAG: Ig-like domain-containing protein [Clostridium sp.]|nr:Ig-like domain-containing protein [Clostridium sp.]